MRIYQIISLIFCCLFLGNFASAAEPEKIAIFSPEAAEPYRSIYQEIISGSHQPNSESPFVAEIKEFVLTKDFVLSEVIEQLNVENITKVIVLGRLGYKLAKLLPKEYSVVSGAMPITPNGVSGISLISDPAFLFDYLAQVAPEVSQIHLAYSRKSEWLVEAALDAAEQRGLTLNLKKVASTKEAIQFYQQLFESDVSKRDAIWLPLDNISSHDKITLPIILEKAWAREVVVFSSKPSHAKRGVLFSTYPDNFLLGQHLFKMVMELGQQPNKKNFAPLSSLQLAVNLRTAAHLGLKYSSEQQQQFKLTFPQ